VICVDFLAFILVLHGTKTPVSGDGFVGGGMPGQDQDGMTGCRYRP
jgi:hypothetical protein